MGSWTNLKKLRPADVRAAWWTWRALRSARRQLAASALDSVELPALPALESSSARAVNAVLRRERATCLERALIVQRWRAAHGDERDLIIGVTAPREGFKAHAWLDGDPPCHEEGFHELVRRHAAPSR